MTHFLKSSYEYNKKRKTFGKQTLFQSVPPQIIDSIFPDKVLQKQYGLLNPVNRFVEATKSQSEHEINTKHLKTREQGINHIEGGWPREVHPEHEEQIHRHCRRIMHDENYIHTVNSLAPVMKHCIYQNNAINMYQTYFSDMPSQEPIEKYNIRVSNRYCDAFKRPVSCIVWTNENDSKLAVCYNQINNNTVLKHKYEPMDEICLWDINSPLSPLTGFDAEIPCWQLACSPVNPEVIIGGFINGTVKVFDAREGPQSVSSSSVYNSHRGPITGLLYTHSRTHTELYTGSTDGQCLWWDIRDLSNPTDSLPISVRLRPGEQPDLSNSEGVSSIEFDRGLPTKFLCGTESGLLVNGNRMGKTHADILYSYWDAHSGPVRSVHRSPCTSRMIITCGDWSVRIWSDEVRSRPIIVTKPYRHQVTDVAWSPLRFSSYMVVCENGVFYYWDLLRKYISATATLQVTKHVLTKIAPHSDGELVALGDDNGSIFLLQLSENMVLPSSRDKALMTQTYERETRREHILDARLKEINVKRRAEEPSLIPESEVTNDEDIDRATEDQYFKIVKEGLRQMEIISTSSDMSLL